MLPFFPDLTSCNPLNLIYTLLIPWLLLYVTLTYTVSLHSIYQISCPLSIAHVVPQDQSRPEARASVSYEGQIFSVRKFSTSPNLPAVRVSIFDIFASNLHTGGRSSIRNLSTCYAVVTGTYIIIEHLPLCFQNMILL